MALAGEADLLVTGDRRAGLLPLGHVGQTRIVTPAQGDPFSPRFLSNQATIVGS